MKRTRYYKTSLDDDEHLSEDKDGKNLGGVFDSNNNLKRQARFEPVDIIEDSYDDSIETYQCENHDDSGDNTLAGLVGAGLLLGGLFVAGKAINAVKNNPEIQRAREEEERERQREQQKEALREEKRLAKERLKMQAAQQKAELKAQRRMEKRKIREEAKMERMREKEKIRQQAKLERMREKEMNKIEKQKEREQKRTASKETVQNDVNNAQNIIIEKEEFVITTPEVFSEQFDQAYSNFFNNMKNPDAQMHMLKIFLLANELAKEIRILSNSTNNSNNFLKENIIDWETVMEKLTNYRTVAYMNYILANNRCLAETERKMLKINFNGGIYEDGLYIPLKNERVKQVLAIR